MHFLPNCKVKLKAAKPTSCPKELRTVGDHLKKRRLDLGLFQKEVALRLSVNDWAIHNWENDTCAPAIRMMPRIIKFHGGLLGLSRARLARRLSVDEGTLAGWEKGERWPAGKRRQLVDQFLTASVEPLSKS